MSFLHTPVYTTCTSGACRGQKRASDPLELKLRMVVSHQVGAGNRTQVLCKSNKCSKLLIHLSNCRSYPLLLRTGSLCGKLLGIQKSLS